MAGERAVWRDGAELAEPGRALLREGGWPRAAMPRREKRTAVPRGRELGRLMIEAASAGFMWERRTQKSENVGGEKATV